MFEYAKTGQDISGDVLRAEESLRHAVASVVHRVLRMA